MKWIMALLLWPAQSWAAVRAMPVVFESTQPVSGIIRDPSTSLEANVTSDAGFNNLNVLVRNAVIVTTVTAQVPIERTQAILDRYYLATSDVQTISGTAEVDFILFVNVATNTVNAFLQKINLASPSRDVSTTLRLYRNPVVTSSGTARMIFPGKFASAPASKMQVYLSPTISARGSNSFVMNASNGQVVSELNQSRIVPPGRNFLLTVQNTTNNRLAYANVEWVEE